jgi:hypothetical protein
MNWKQYGQWKKTFSERVFEAIRAINANHGRGDVIRIKLFLNGKGEFTQKPFGLKARQRYFRLVSKGNKTTVFCLGHQRTILTDMPEESSVIKPN